MEEFSEQIHNYLTTISLADMMQNEEVMALSRSHDLRQNPPSESDLQAAEKLIGEDIDAESARYAGLITFALDDIDWEDEIRLLIEERASFSLDALVGMEANLRFAGPETMETRIFGRLTAWQNWIFQRPNAVSEAGALQLYGSGKRANYDKVRV